MKSLVFVLCFVGLSASAASNLETAVRDLTHEAILVRVGLSEKCKVDPGLLPFAGAQLESSYDNALAGFEESDLTVAAWKKMTAKDCARDCSCSALSKVYEKYPDVRKKKISRKKVESALAKMTDDSYRKCMERLPQFCEIPKVREFIKTLSQNKPIADDAP